LSLNTSIPWNLKFLKKFEDKIDWTKNLTNESGVTTFEMKNISANRSIEWDTKLLSTFIKKLNKCHISISYCAKWNIDLLNQFEDFWDYDTLTLNKLVWDKIFS